MVGYAKNALSDDLHNKNLGLHAPLWLYIVEKYKNPPSSPIVGLGHLVASPLIELSQWDFPITHVVSNYDRMLAGKKDNEIQAGFFNEMFYFDFLNNSPQGRVTTFIGIAEYLTEERLFNWLDLLLRRSREVIFAVPKDRDWHGVLIDHYDTYMAQYPKADYYLISIKDKYGITS